MKRSMKKIMMAGWVLLLTVSVSAGASVTVSGSSADQVRRSDEGSLVAVKSAASKPARIGNDTAVDGIFSAWVIPFLLPDIGTETISSASIHTYFEKTGGLPATSGVFLDLLGVRVSASSTVIATDYQGTVIGDNLYNLATSALPSLGPVEFSSAGLAAYLQSIYDNDANAAGKYVFLTIAPDATLPKYNYVDFTTAEGDIVENRPVLELQLGTSPSAGFSAAPSDGWIPLTVTFTDSSTGFITNRFWDFGDGAVTNTAETSLTHIYTSAGTYNVTLVVQGPDGADTNLQTSCILVSDPIPPTASFTATPVSGNAPLTVSFTDSSTGSITGRFWDFGDGVTTNTTLTGIQHTYTEAGTYTVELVASGPSGISTNRQTDCIRVEAQTAVVISIIGDPADQLRRSDESSRSAGSTPARIGNDTEFDGIFSAWVIPFLLPDIGSETISSASIHTYFEKTGGLAAVSDVFLDLLGVRVAASSTVLSTDYQGTVVGSNLYNMATSALPPLGPVEFSSPGLAAYLQSIYDQDANAAGKYVFLTIAPNAPQLPYNYMDFTTAEGAIVANRPVLNITLGTQSETDGDADGDGLPDEWEEQYFGGITHANPHAMAANGVNTILEAYVAGLNPTNPASVFLISDFRSLTSASTLQWQSASGRVYSVYGTTNLLNGFQPLQTNILWPQSSWTDQVHEAAGGVFYQLKVQMHP